MPRDFSRPERRKHSALFTTKTRHGERRMAKEEQGSRGGRKSTRINLVRDYRYDLLWETARDYEIARNTNRPRVTRSTRSFSRLMIPFCLPSLVSSNAYAYFLRALDIVASFYVYIYIHVVYTRTFLFHRLRFSVETFAQIAEKSVRQSRRIIRDVFVDRSRALNSKRGKRDRIKRGYYSSWPDWSG